MIARWSSARPLLFLRGLRARRDHPDLAALAAETDPERFVWRTLPHAARSFASSVVVLPRAQALAAAVAYLYCRILDTYEDLLPDEGARPEALRRFAGRFDDDRMAPPDPIADSLARDERDRLNLLLVHRCDMVDAVFSTLPAETRDAIAQLVTSMAEGMAGSAEKFRSQGGVLMGGEQLAEYCHHVIGNPALFMLQLVGGEVASPAVVRDARAVSVMIQLANITRDIEKDLHRGIGYHATLEPFLNGAGDPEERDETVRLVREEFLGVALAAVPAYRRLFEASSLHHAPGARMAAVLMLLHTDWHYRRTAAMIGHRPWGKPPGKLRMTATAIPALLSMTAARRVLLRVEEDFLRAALGVGATAG